MTSPLQHAAKSLNLTHNIIDSLMNLIGSRYVSTNSRVVAYRHHRAGPTVMTNYDYNDTQAVPLILPKTIAQLALVNSSLIRVSIRSDYLQK